MRKSEKLKGVEKMSGINFSFAHFIMVCIVLIKGREWKELLKFIKIVIKGDDNEDNSKG